MKNKLKVTCLTVFLLVLVSVLLTGCFDETIDDDVRVIRVAVSASSGDCTTLGYKKLAEILDEKTDGKIRLDVYADAVLGDDRSTVEAVQENTLDAADSSTPNFAPFMQEFMAFDLPYITSPQYQQNLYNALDYGPLGDYYRKLCEEKGFHLFGFFEYGYRNFVTTDREIKSIADMKNLKLRTTNSSVEIAVAQALGAQAMPMGWSETYTALAQGTVDGEGNTWTLLNTAHHTEVLKYGINTKHNYSGKIFLMSLKLWESLDKETQDLLTESFFEAVEWQREIAAEMEVENEKAMKDAGVSIYTPTDKEMKQFADATEGVWDDYVGDRIPQKAVDLIRATQTDDYVMLGPDGKPVKEVE